MKPPLRRRPSLVIDEIFSEDVDLFIVSFERGDDGEVVERGCVAFNFAATCQLLEDAAHDFAASGLW